MESDGTANILEIGVNYPPDGDMPELRVRPDPGAVFDDLAKFKTGLSVSRMRGHRYFFGYESVDTPSRAKTSVIRQVKKLYGVSGLSDDDISEFVSRPLSAGLDAFGGALDGVSCIVCPFSSRTSINRDIVEGLASLSPSVASAARIELVKYPSAEVGLDFKELKRDRSHRPRFFKACRTAHALLDSVNSRIGDFFISEYVKVIFLRPYMRHFLHFKDGELDAAGKAIDGKHVLIVDDVNTTGATIDEVLRRITEVAKPSRVTIYTLFGKTFVR
jgi:hypothetical protein